MTLNKKKKKKEYINSKFSKKKKVGFRTPPETPEACPVFMIGTKGIYLASWYMSAACFN